MERLQEYDMEMKHELMTKYQTIIKKLVFVEHKKCVESLSRLSDDILPKDINLLTIKYAIKSPADAKNVIDKLDENCIIEQEWYSFVDEIAFIFLTWQLLIILIIMIIIFYVLQDIIQYYFGRNMVLIVMYLGSQIPYFIWGFL